MRSRGTPHRRRWAWVVGAVVVLAGISTPAVVRAAPAPASPTAPLVASAVGAVGSGAAVGAGTAGAVAVPAVAVRVLPPVDAGVSGERASGRAPAHAGRFRELQMNLCNSGLASCYTRLNNGWSVAEARAVIRSTSPDLVTLNEICQSDAMTSLLPVMRQDWPGDWVFASFMPAYDRRTGGPYRCADGEEYGVGVLGRVPAARWHGVTATGAPYPDSHTGIPTQDPASPEQRAWLCTVAVGDYLGCTTHLASTSPEVAAHQCRYLISGVLPTLAAHHGGRTLPAIVGGDLNLRHGGSPNVQDCVRPGWFRKGDGTVQHVMATTRFTFDFGQAITLEHTDHPAWLVSLTPR